MPEGPSQDTSDLELWYRAASGDRDAFGAVFERYQHIVFRFARSMVGCPDAAADVTQEVFMILMRDVTRYEPGRSVLSTYLYGVARNVSRDRLRRERRLLSLASRPAADRSECDQIDRIATVETGAEVRRALARLALKHREVVVLCDLHDLSYGDVAKILGTSEAAVRSRLHRGRNLLRRRLQRLARASAPRSTGSLRCSA